LPQPPSYSFQDVAFQWHGGERRVNQSAPERRALLEHVVEALVAELRRRLGGRFYTQELVALYGQGTSWCLQMAMQLAPDDPWAWDAALVADAAFARYLHAAADYAGGRHTVDE
jgi:hypothetical protein